MKFPRTIRTFCPYCRKHTKHVVEEVKKKKASELKWGQRQFRRVIAGYRGYPRPLPTGSKPTKKRDLRYRCEECKKSQIRGKGFRAKKLEFEE